MISTRGRYAIRVMIDLAEHDTGNYVPLKDIAERQGISKKYLEIIVKDMVAGGLIIGASGKGGGYLMTRKPEECTVADVLTATEESMAPVACLACETLDCDRSDTCKTLPMWQKFDSMTHDFFTSVTIADLVNGTVKLDS